METALHVTRNGLRNEGCGQQEYSFPSDDTLVSRLIHDEEERLTTLKRTIKTGQDSLARRTPFLYGLVFGASQAIPRSLTA
jgi:hypothetical protein